jgi:hypothetical protein
MTRTGTTMYCPKCGDALKEEEGTFTCLRGDMTLLQYMAVHLYSCVVSRTEEAKEFHFTAAGYTVGGLWFCPGCGLVVSEETPGAQCAVLNAGAISGAFCAAS